jgi:hypothetical protein
MRAKRGRLKVRAPAERPRAVRHNSSVPLWVAGLLIFCFAAQCLASMSQQSATYDEPVYIAAGYSYVESGDFRLKPDAPPLVATLSGLALGVGTLFGNAVFFDRDSRLWSGRTEYQFSRQFLARAEDRQRTLLIARLPVVLIAAVLGAYLYRFGRLLIGEYGALLPLFLYAFDPNMIAHGRTVSNDMAVAAFFFIAHYYFYRLLTESGRANLAGLAAAVALTIAAKFSGLLVVPSLALLGVTFYLFPSIAPLPREGASVSERRRRVLRAGAQGLAVSAAASAVAVTLLYQSAGGVGQYIAGVRSIYTNGTPDFQFYLLGEFSPSASWYYYLVAMLLKTPDVTLLLFAVAIASVFVPRTEAGRGAWLLVPVGLVLAVCSQDPVTLGLRRVLFVYPFLFLWTGQRLNALRELSPTAGGAQAVHPVLRKGLAVAAALCAAIAVASAVRIHPHQLAYFNWFAGGPGAGHRYLDDSNIDWGQDLPGLAAWQSAAGVRPLALSYFGTDDPAGYGIDSRPMREDELLQPDRAAYAISVNNLIGLKLRAQATGHAQFDWLTRYTPAATIGYSINIYDFR